ncbi:hypothetical protein M406DRAFT_273759 [Cryphonectria parasitica EP155]|uniref:Anaphase-promoting complex subunit 2 n=1 Tax=Cryphonectria parasitica (strain ATCC 38755 / EP155) TaxID=660469 RepID=A0A9P4YAN6_CRYP1|nr:uncharacterized protein M406DRAFT_273759 [Cryphonectria parasitica EP155]KAF3769170.1 hypothetical protein M406DRAFT_273759 [Cryphonectria parasitica EP155]
MEGGPMAALQRTAQHLQSTFRQYFARLSPIIRAMEQGNCSGDPNTMSDAVFIRFTHDLHALVADAAGPILPVMRAVFDPLIEQTLQMPRAETKTKSARQSSKWGSIGGGDARERLLQLVEALNQVGMAGESFQVLFAEIMDKKMTEYVHQSYARVWRCPSKFESGGRGLNREVIRTLGLSQASWCILSLCNWIENCFARLALEVLSRVEKTSTKSKIVSLAYVQQWKETGIGRIAALRTSELFDIVLAWPASKGALDDLKASVTTPQRRWQLTEAFSSALQNRLLHPARSTLDILRVYISMIRAFHALDHSKVLLSRVVPSLQLYLVQREDAVRIVVTGLLASPEEVEAAEKSSSPPPPSDDGACKKLVELAVLLNDPDQQRRTDVDEDDLDWDDLNWVPDPVDAGINYRRPKSEDVIGTLISTLGSEEVFIKEFQNIISEHLLSNQTDFAQEQRVLDLLQKRFSESALQNCEVMIKDIYDSRKVDTRIRRVQLGQPAQPARTFGTPATPPTYMDMGRQLDLDEEEQGQVPYHARILSRLYWPDIVQETFNLPQPVAQQQGKYEIGYERLKSSRKLTWLHQLGQATVELELEDRTINVECKTFEAAVIYAFQDSEGDQEAEGGGTSGPTRRTVQELQEILGMDEELVLQALETWELEGVIARYSTSPDTYVVLERKDSPLTRPELHPSASAPAALEGEHQVAGMPPKPSGVKRAGTTSAMDAKENERRAMYWQFIVGMLTNSMPMMPLGQMAMMMRTLIPDGFSWSDQELQEFLAEKVESGELQLVGAKYKLAKK